MMSKKITQHPFPNYFLPIFVLAITYFLAGQLGNLLAIPPNFSTVIFPSSGIALAGVLLYGKRAGVGILLGAFFLNYSLLVTENDLSENFNSALVTFVITVGSTLQAVVGAYLIERFAATGGILTSKKNILLFFFYGGLISTLVNSISSVLLLVGVRQIPVENILSNWLSWWIGDALGIIIFAPLFLIWLSKENSIWQGKKWEITLPISLLFVITVIAVFYEIKNSDERMKIEFEQRATELSLVLESSINTKLNALRSLHNFYISSSDINRNEFRTFATEQLKNFKGIQAMQWVPIVLAADRNAYEKSVQNEGFPNFQITERDANNQMVRAGDRDVYASVNFNEPYQGNEIVNGYDNYSEPLRRKTLEQARDGDDLVMSQPIKLVQEQGDKNGILAFMPVYQPNLPHETIVERRNAIAGYIVVVFRMGDMMTETFKNRNLKHLTYQLIDISNDNVGDQMLFTNNEQEFKAARLREYARKFMSVSTINHGYNFWQFEIVPTPDYLIEHRSSNIYLILMTAFILMIITIMDALMTAIRDNEKETRAQELALSYEKNRILDIQVSQMQKIESIGRLTSGMAHEFNNILGCIIGYNEMNQYVSEDMTEENLKSELNNNIQQVSSAVKRAEDLINKMLAYCRQDEPKNKMDVQPTQAVIKEALEMLRPALTSRIQIQFIGTCHINQEDCNTCGIRNNCKTNIQIDAIDLQQILTNLLLNARDSIQEQTGVINISLTSTHENSFCVACAAPVDGDFIQLSVSDNGLGIEQKIITRLFDPFFTTKPQGEGTGLGLSVMSGIVHRAGGHIFVESRQNQSNHGTTFKILFPIS